MGDSFFFLENGGSATTPPGVYLAGKPVDAGKGPPIQVELPDIFTDASAVSQPPFSFSVDPYRITIDNGPGGAWDFSILTFSNSNVNLQFRPALAVAYTSFLAQVAQYLNLGATQSSGVALLQQMISGAMPLTFQESLFYRYSFLPASASFNADLNAYDGPANAPAWVDLVPGMRLRIESEAYQMISPSTSNPLNGFVSNGTTYVEIGSNVVGAPQLAVNPFLTQALLSVTLNTVQPSTAAAGGIVDLVGQYKFPYWRLCYPQLLLPSAASQGWAGSQQNVTLLGAPSRAALEAVTQAYVANGVVDASGVGVYFYGRTVVVPEIAVFIAGRRTWVPLGTSLRNALETVTALPYFGAAGIAVDTGPPVLYRGVPPGKKWRGPAWAPVQLGSGTGGYQYYSTWLGDSFDLPLLAGDVINVALPS